MAPISHHLCRHRMVPCGNTLTLYPGVAGEGVNMTIIHSFPDYVDYPAGGGRLKYSPTVQEHLLLDGDDTWMLLTQTTNTVDCGGGTSCVGVEISPERAKEILKSYLAHECAYTEEIEKILKDFFL